MSTILFSVLCSLAAIIVAIALILKIMKEPAGDKKMQDIAQAIQVGAKAYLNRQYKTVAVVAVIAAALIGWGLGLTTMFAFLVGAIASAIAGYIGMNISVRANVKTAEAAKSGLQEALAIAFQGGSVTGLSWWASRFSRSPFFMRSRIT